MSLKIYFFTISLLIMPGIFGQVTGKFLLHLKKTWPLICWYTLLTTHHSLHMALSYDGYTFTSVNNGEPVVAGDTISDQKGIRDPISAGAQTGLFILP
jgi:hypothetical protein